MPISTKLCSKCNTENPVEANFCRHCGNAFPDGKGLPVKVTKNPINIILLGLTIIFGVLTFLLTCFILNDWKQYVFHEDAEEIISLKHKRDKIKENLPSDEDFLDRIIKIPDDFVLVRGGELRYEYWNPRTDKKEHRDYQIDSFYVCSHELTQGEYQKLISEFDSANYKWDIPVDGFYEFKAIYVKGDNLPVVAHYIDFAEYCNKRSVEEGYDGFYIIKDDIVTFNPQGNGYRLLFEVEWIFAAQGGNKQKDYKYVGSNNLNEVAWYAENSNNVPHEICTKKANAIGLYDMAGNVAELLESENKNKGCLIAGCDFYIWNFNENQFSSDHIVIMPDGELCGTRLALIPRGLENRNDEISTTK